MKFVPRIVTRWTFWLAVGGALALYAVLGFFLVPRIVQSEIRSTVASNYQRVAQVGKVRFNPFTFVLEINDCALPDADGRPMLQFARLHIDFELMSILRRAYSFQAIALDAPSARVVVRPNDTLNLADLAHPRQPAAQTQSPPAKDEALPRLFIGAFTVNGGRIDFEALNRATPFATALKPINFALHNFSTFGTGDNAYRLEGESVRGERLSWRGRLNAQPVSSTGEFTLTSIHAQTLWNYLRDVLPFEVPAGQLDLTGTYTFSLARQPIDLTVVASEIKVGGLVVRPQGSQVDDVALSDLAIHDARLQIPDRRVSIAEISLKGGKIQAWLDKDGTFNLSRLAARESASTPTAQAGAPAAQPPTGAAPAQPPAATPPATGQDRPWSIALPHIATSGLEVTFEDRTLTPVTPVRIAHIEIDVSGYDSAKPGPIDLKAHLGIEEDGVLNVRGRVDPNTFASTMDLELGKIDLRSAQPYIARVTDMTLLSGQLGAKGKVELVRDRTDTLQPRYAGTLQISKLRTIDNALEQDFVRWDQLNATGIDFDGTRSRLVIKEIAARRPYARVIIASNGTVNISEVLRPSSPAEPGEAASEGPATDQAPSSKPSPAGAPGAAAAPSAETFDVRIGLVRIDRGSANFADFSLKPNFATGIQELSGTVAGLSSKPGSRATVKLEGKVDAYAPVTIDGEVNYLSAESYTDLKLAFNNMELTTFTPYSGKFAGYRIEKGKLSVQLAYKVENRQLEAQQKFVLDQLQLGEKVESKDAVSLPVKLAVALLKDRNGVIDIDLPMTGSLDDPHFRLGPLIWKAVVNLLTKIVTAPFALIGKLFGGGEEVNQLTFAPGGSELQGESATRVESIGKAMRERPGLQLEVPVTANAELDGPHLQQTELDQRLLAIKRKELLAKRKPVDTLDASVLADKEEYWRLLYEYDQQAAVLPTEGDKDQKGKPGKAPPPEELDAQITTLRDAALTTIQVPETDLAQLGKERAQKVQDLLLGPGDIDPSRLFIINAGPAPIAEGLVRMDLSLR